MTGNDAELKIFLYVCSCKAPTPDSYSSVVGYKSDNQMRRLQTIILLLALPLVVVAQRPASHRIPKDAIFYNSKWQGVSQAGQAAYYRLLAVDDRGQKLFYDYYITGQLRAEKHYVNINRKDDRRTVLTGVARTFHRSGRVESIMRYKNGKAHGRAVSFYPSGMVGMKLNYNNGLLNGTTYTYNESGKLEYTTVWRNGSKVSEQRGGHDKYISQQTHTDSFCEEYRKDEPLIMAQAQAVASGMDQQKPVARSGERELPSHKTIADVARSETPVADNGKVSPSGFEREKTESERLAETVRYPEPGIAEPSAHETPATVPPVADIQSKPTTKKGARAQLKRGKVTDAAAVGAATAARIATTQLPKPVRQETEKPAEPSHPAIPRAKGEFSFAALYQLLAGGENRTNELTFFDSLAASHGLTLSQTIKGHGAQKELAYNHNMYYDDESGKDIVSGENPRQMGFFGVGMGNRFTIQRINLYTSSADEMTHLAEDALAQGFTVLGGGDFRDMDGNFVLQHPAHNKAGDPYAVIVIFTHVDGAYAGLYHVQLEAK